MIATTIPELTDRLSLTRLERFDGPGVGHGWRVVSVNQAPA